VPEQESKLSIAERPAGDVTILVLKGEITLDDGDLKVGRKVDDLLKKGRLKILLDMAGVGYIDSAGVGMLAAEYKIVHAKGGSLRLLRLAKQSHRLLATMKLITVFEVFEDEALAIRSFERV
jgi:anti-sigma B factor antagonist